METPENVRKAEHPIDPLFLRRWSSRAMNGKKIEKEKLLSLFEAARWAPSSYNGQPWRYLYALRETPFFAALFNLLVEFNQSWCKNAAALALIISRKTFEKNDKPSVTHSFDTGSSFTNLCLQGSLMDLVVHGMQGFNYEEARKVGKIPDHYQVEAMVAIGNPGKKEDLPEEIQAKEIFSSRKPLAEIICEGSFSWEK